MPNLSGRHNATVTTLTLKAGGLAALNITSYPSDILVSFPGVGFEVMTATATPGTDQLTVTRGVAQTVPTDFIDNAAVELYTSYVANKGVNLSLGTIQTATDVQKLIDAKYEELAALQDKVDLLIKTLDESGAILLPDELKQ